MRLLILVFVLFCGRVNCGSFFEKIGVQISSAWDTFITVMKQPVHPKGWGSTDKLKAEYGSTKEIVPEPTVYVPVMLWHPRKTTYGYKVFVPYLTPDVFAAAQESEDRSTANFKIEYGKHVTTMAIHMKRRNDYYEVDKTTLALRKKVTVPFLREPRHFYETSTKNVYETTIKDAKGASTYAIPRVIKYNYDGNIAFRTTRGFEPTNTVPVYRKNKQIKEILLSLGQFDPVLYNKK